MKINTSNYYLEQQDKKLLQKCYELEASFWHIMLKEMSKTTTLSQKESLETSDYFKDMFHLEVAKELAKDAGSGLAEAMYKQFKTESNKN